MEKDALEVYFGSGSFWHTQHMFVQKEVQDLNREDASVSAVAGYAGGTKVGDMDRVCYHNPVGAPDFAKMGHAMAVKLSLPPTAVGNFAKAYFDEVSATKWGREDKQDRGPEFRNVIGIPGGMKGATFKQLEEANAGRMKLLTGVGDEPDTILKGTVYVYDTRRFPFRLAEIYQQFHPDFIDRYTKEYIALKDKFIKLGKIYSNECPPGWTI